MKRLLGLCALLFAGHTMACSVSDLHGAYIGRTEGSLLSLPNVVNFHSIASAVFYGNGQGKADVRSMAGGVSIVDYAKNITYSVTDSQDGSGTCEWTIYVSYPLGVLPNLAVTLKYIGKTGPSFNKVVVITDTVGTSISGVVEKAD